MSLVWPVMIILIIFFSRNLRGKVFKKIVKYYKKGVLFNQDNDVFFFESAPLKGHNMYKV